MRTIIDIDAPAALTFGAGEMDTERQARLLETGSYPDKNLTITEADLDGIVARFGEAGGSAPVKVEHVDSPLDPLGVVQALWREGSALLARLAFPADLAGFLRRRGVEKLSVGLSRDPLALAEVSLVLKPRLQSATLMSHGVEMSENDKDAEIVRLRRELLAREVDGLVAQFKREGRVVPATESLARDLLSVDGGALVTFADGQTAPVAETFARFLALLPPSIRFGETAAAPGANAEPLGLTEAEQAFLRERLGVDPAQVAARLRAEREEGTP